MKGKSQLAAPESAKFLNTALATLKETPDHDGPLVAALPLLCSIDGQEIFRLQVRDLDLSATRLIIRDGKTEQRKRTLEIPEVVQPHMVHFPAQAANRSIASRCKW